MVTRSKSENDNRANLNDMVNSDQFLGDRISRRQNRIDTTIVCHKCGYRQENGNECAICGVIFAKIKDENLISKPLIANEPKIEGCQTLKHIRLIKSWILFSTIYLICVVLYSMLIFQNERERPYRDRMIATVHLIEYSDFELEVEALEEELEDMIDRRVRKSADMFESVNKKTLIHPLYKVGISIVKGLPEEARLNSDG